MAELFGVRADGAFRTDTSAADDNINKDWDITFTPQAAADFYNLIGVAPGSNYNTYQGIQDIVVDGVGAYTCKACTSDSGIFRSRPAILLDKRNLTAVSHTIKSRAYGNNSNAGGGAAGNGIALWSLADAQWAELASATNSTTAWTDILTKTFTPASQQDYLIIASIERAYVGASNQTGYLDLDIDGTEYGYHYEVGYHFASGYGEPPVSFTKVINLSAASHTIKIRAKASATYVTLTMSNLRIIAIPLGNRTYQSNEGTDPQTTTSSTFQTCASVSITASDKWYLIVGYAEVDNNVHTGLRLSVDGVLHSVNCVKVDERISCGLLTIDKIKSGAARTVALQFASQNGTGIARVNRPRIVAIDVSSDIQKLRAFFRSSSGWDGFLTNVTAEEVECNMDSTGFSNNTAYTDVGKNVSNQKINSGARFLNVDVRQGAVLTSAAAIIQDYTDKTFATKVYGFDEDNTAQFSTNADYKARLRTTATVDWTPGGAGWKRSGDIKTVIQEITDRVGFVQGNALAYELDGANAASNNYYEFNTMDYNANIARPWGLEIIWEEVIAIITSISISDTGVGSDAIADISAGIPISETGSGSELLSILNALTLSDAGSGVDTPSPLGLYGVADTGSLSSELLDILASIALSDANISATDLISILADLALAESGSGADIVSVDTGITPVNISDSGISSEALQILAEIALSDSGLSSEALSILVSIALSDTGASSEVLALLASFLISDTGAGSELLDLFTSLSLTDSATGSDVAQMLYLMDAITDSGVGSDAISILAQIAVSDTGAASEALDILAQLVISDSGSASEALSLLISLALSDTGVAGEAIDILVTLALSDSGVGSEVVAAIGLFSVSDTGTSSETLSILAELVISESGIASEALSVLASFALQDTGAGVEAVQILASVAVNEAGLASEAVSLLAHVVQGDTGAATEALSVLASLVVADTGVGSEILSILASFALSDTGSGSDALSILAEVAVSDSGLASEAISILAQVAISDSGLAGDAVSILAQLSVSDSAIASEVVNLFVDLIVNDAGLGSETINILVGFLISDTGAGSDLAGRVFSKDVSDSATAREIINLLVLKLSQMGGNLSTLQSKLYNKATSALYNKGGSLKTGGSSLFTKR